MRAQNKNYNTRNGFYIQDAETTLVKYQFPLNDKFYYLLSWEGDKPTSVLARYKESGRNEKVNKIMTYREVYDYLEANAVDYLPVSTTT